MLPLQPSSRDELIDHGEEVRMCPGKLIVGGEFAVDNDHGHNLDVVRLRDGLCMVDLVDGRRRIV
jgi:hypothetical protein